MSINKTTNTEDRRDQDVDPKQAASIDENVDSEISDRGNLEIGDYEGRKHKPDIDGPQQESQETDDVYEDGRGKDAKLPPAGKNVGDLNAFDLGRHDDD